MPLGSLALALTVPETLEFISARQKAFHKKDANSFPSPRIPPAATTRLLCCPSELCGMLTNPSLIRRNFCNSGRVGAFRGGGGGLGRSRGCAERADQSVLAIALRMELPIDLNWLLQETLWSGGSRRRALPTIEPFLSCIPHLDRTLRFRSPRTSRNSIRCQGAPLGFSHLSTRLALPSWPLTSLLQPISLRTLPQASIRISPCVKPWFQRYLIFPPPSLAFLFPLARSVLTPRRCTQSYVTDTTSELRSFWQSFPSERKLFAFPRSC